MMKGKVGDEVFEESERVGQKGRTGEVLEVLGTDDGVHYHVRWDDGHETLFFPKMGSVKFVSPVKSQRSS